MFQYPQTKICPRAAKCFNTPILYTTDLRKKQQKYKHYHLEKLINKNILQVKKYCLLIKEK